MVKPQFGPMAHGLAVTADRGHLRGRFAPAICMAFLRGSAYTCARMIGGERAAFHFVCRRRSSTPATRLRNSGEYGFAGKCKDAGLVPEKSANTASAPSSDVPDIMPIYNVFSATIQIGRSGYRAAAPVARLAGAAACVKAAMYFGASGSAFGSATRNGSW